MKCTLASFVFLMRLCDSPWHFAMQFSFDNGFILFLIWECRVEPVGLSNKLTLQDRFQTVLVVQ